jgi:hypothetical protein
LPRARQTAQIIAPAPVQPLDLNVGEGFCSIGTIVGQTERVGMQRYEAL